MLTMKAPVPACEIEKLAALESYEVLDTAPEKAFDDITRLASQLCSAPIALITFVDGERQWFKSRVGLTESETPRELIFCAHTILQNDVLVVHDALEDERFATNALVTSAPHIRFYAGAPLLTPEGQALGTVCVLDRVPRELTPEQKDALQILSRQVIAQLELRRSVATLARDLDERRFVKHELRKSEERYKNLVEQANDVIYQTDIAGRFIFVNPTALKILKCVEEDVVPHSYLKVTHPDHREAANQFYTRQLKERIPNTYYEFIAVAKDGEEVWLGQNVQLRVEGDKIMGFQAVARDITERKRTEEALRKSNREISIILESVTDAFYALDREWRFTYVNSAAEHVLGRNRDELIGRSVWEEFPEAVGTAFHAQYYKAMAGNVKIDFEEYYPPFDAWFSVRAYPSETGLSIYFQNVTEQRQLEETKKKSEEYRNLFKLANDPILIFDPAEEIVLDVNDKACEVYGIERQEFIGRSLKEMSQDVARGDQQLKALLADGAYREFETTQIRSDGTPLNFQVNSSVIEFQGRRAILSINRDITASRRAEVALLSQQEFMRKIVNVNPNLIFVKDCEGRFTLVNQALADLYGTTIENLIGKSHADFSSNEEETQSLLNDDREVMETLRGKFIAQESVTNSLTGEVRWFQTTKVPLVAPDGMSPLLLGVSTDITERKQAEEALHQSEEQLRQSQKMESIGTLAGGVAHDFNNLLTTIMLNTQLATAKLQPADPLHYRFTEISKASARAADLTRQLLAFSRRQTLERKVIDLNDTIGDIMKMVRRIIGEDIEIHVQSAPNLPAIFADPTQIEQVIMNLAVNARDAMPTGGKLFIETQRAMLDEVFCRKHPYASPGDYVQLKVTDTGCGISAETQQRIFEPFFTTKEVGKGTGLGLAMAYGIVKQHNGLIEVRSKVGHGTTFEIFLPVNDHAVGEEQTDELLPMQGGTETILVVEDEAELRELAKDVLESVGYTVLLGSDGEEGAATFASNAEHIDLVILDVVMPRTGGRVAYERIRRLSQSVPVIFMTGYSAEISQSEFIEETGAALIQKPYSIEALARKVRDTLDAPVKGHTPSRLQ